MLTIFLARTCQHHVMSIKLQPSRKPVMTHCPAVSDTKLDLLVWIVVARFPFLDFRFPFPLELVVTYQVMIVSRGNHIP